MAESNLMTGRSQNRSIESQKNHNTFKRNLKIVRLIDSGTMTLEEVGSLYGLTRERVRQIHKRETGRGARLYQKKKREITEARIEKELDRVLHNCRYCGKPVTRRVGKGLRTTCRECRDIQLNNKTPGILVTCKYCGIEFHPNRAYEFIEQKPLYHSISCARKDWWRRKRQGLLD